MEGGEQSQGGVSPARLQGEEVSRTCPLPGTLSADHRRGGRGTGQKPKPAQGSWDKLPGWTRGRLWDSCLPLHHTETHFSIPDAGTQGFSASCPTVLWGQSSLTLQPPFKGILLLPYGCLRKLGGSTQERRLPRETRGGRGGRGNRLWGSQGERQSPTWSGRLPLGPTQSDLGARCSV